MPVAKLLQMVKDQDFDGFETFCLEALEAGTLSLRDLVAPFEQLERAGCAERAATIGQMVLENVDSDSDPAAALTIARIALLGDQKNEALRQRVVALYRQVYADVEGFESLLEASGLLAGRPVRNALRMIDICTALKPGDALMSRAEDVVVEVLEVDLPSGLITLRHPRRTLTITAAELAREYDRIAADDFRVLQALHPEKLPELIQSDPLAVVVGLIRAHGDMVGQDVIKSELVPQFIAAREWSKWWTKVRRLCQRDPHIILEGRNPVTLRYTSEVWTVEDATWDSFAAASEPAQWLTIVEGYLREKKKHKETPDAELIGRCCEHIEQHRRRIEQVRPAEALACLLVARRIARLTGQDDTAEAAALEMLRGAADPAGLIGRLVGDALWRDALELLESAAPEQVGPVAVALFDRANANLLDELAALACKAGLAPQVQGLIDAALADPVNHPEIMFWLWKGPRQTDGLRLPDDDELFGEIIATLSALGRTLHAEHEVAKQFRGRMRTALGLRDYARATACVQRVSADRAVTLRRQLERLEGMGHTTTTRLLGALREAHPELWAVKPVQVQPWEAPNVLWNTAEGIRRMTEQRDHLVNVKMRENAKRIGEAASHGDLSENSEYKFALEERDFLRARLARMNQDLSLAREIEPHMVPTDHVGVGSRVTLRDVDDGSTMTMTLLGPFDTDVDRGIYNYRAPVCQSLMGLHVGDRCTITLDKRQRQFEVVAIENGLTAAATPQTQETASQQQ